MRDPLKDALTKRFARLHVAVFKATGGAIGARFRGAPTLLLTTVGRRSGEPRVTPVLYLELGDRKVVVASYGGDHRHPTWYLNLTANPEVTVRAGRESQRMRAEVAGPEERAELWPRLVAMFPAYDAYQKKAAREIPVVVLMPA